MTDHSTREPVISEEVARDRFRGCLLAGALGDALGAAVEFSSYDAIVSRFGPQGITDLAVSYGVPGAVTDDTQMTLFTAEGLLRSQTRGMSRGMVSVPGVTHHAYLRWLATQDGTVPDDVRTDGWLWTVNELHHRRAPGNTCLSALAGTRSFGVAAQNNSKGCGGVMRMAPVGLFTWRRPHTNPASAATDALKLGCELAGLTHGHPSGQWPAGALAVLVMRLVDGVSLLDALNESLDLLSEQPSAQETVHALVMARDAAESARPPGVNEVQRLGEGWVAEEALAIAVYCALVAEGVEEALLLAVNHGGDSDSTGAIAGNLVGARDGALSIPPRWAAGVELHDVIVGMADDLLDYRTWPFELSETIWERYPGW